MSSPIKMRLNDGTEVPFGAIKEVYQPGQLEGSGGKAISRSKQRIIHSVQSRKPEQNASYKVYKLDELTLSPAEFAEAKTQILELYRKNTFNPFNYPFFVAVDPQNEKKIIAVMQVPIVQKFMHQALGLTPINTDITSVVANLIRLNAIPGMTETNAWHNAGIVVDPGFQGRGVAKALLERKIQWLKTTQSDNAKYMLFAYDKENHASEKWHSKLNSVPLDPALTELQIANRPCVLKVLDLSQTLFK